MSTGNVMGYTTNGSAFINGSLFMTSMPYSFQNQTTYWTFITDDCTQTLTPYHNFIF